MKNTTNNIALGLGVAVIGFSLYRYFKGQGSAPMPTSPNGGATWSLLNFGGSTNGPSPLALDNPYASTAWNPDALSGAMSQDLSAALAKAGESGINSFGFTLP